MVRYLNKNRVAPNKIPIGKPSTLVIYFQINRRSFVNHHPSSQLTRRLGDRVYIYWVSCLYVLESLAPINCFLSVGYWLLDLSLTVYGSGCLIYW